MLLSLSLPPGPFPTSATPDVSLETWGFPEGGWGPREWMLSGLPPPSATGARAKPLRIPSVLLPPRKLGTSRWAGQGARGERVRVGIRG